MAQQQKATLLTRIEEEFVRRPPRDEYERGWAEARRRMDAAGWDLARLEDEPPFGVSPGWNLGYRYALDHYRNMLIPYGMELGDYLALPEAERWAVSIAHAIRWLDARKGASAEAYKVGAS